jgi:protein involved in ribonucleotide reduction
MTCLANTNTVKSYVKRLRDAGMTVNENKEAGTVEVKDGNIVVYKAIQKGRGGSWIVSTSSSPNVKWS